MIKKQLFLSHTWRLDNLNRHTHQRVNSLAEGLRKYGWTTWFDEDDMIGNIDAAMAAGIDNCDCVLVCLTEEYCKKVNQSARDPYLHDNCEKEWNYAINRDKLMLPIILESSMLNTSKWPPGVVPLYLSSILYVDASKEDLSSAIKEINKRLLAYNIIPLERSNSNRSSKSDSRTSSRSSDRKSSLSPLWPLPRNDAPILNKSQQLNHHSSFRL